ncbi:MAG: 4Fe-4S dicluster domain-containing protein [Promethearchaeota archaeon]
MRAYLVEEVEEKQTWEIHVIDDRCKGCEICITYCPVQHLELSKKFNAKGYHPPQVRTDSVDCLGCGFCQLVCPDFAIFIKEKVK